jgi:hypothetical protein
MDDARERWRAEHRRRRIRNRRLAPWLRALSNLLLVAAVVFAAAAVALDIAWFGGTIVCVFSGLLARGIPLSEIFGAGSPDGYVSDGGGDGGGDAG